MQSCTTYPACFPAGRPDPAFREAQCCVFAGAKVVAFTAHRTAPLPYADTVVRLPVQPPLASTQVRSFTTSSSADQGAAAVQSSVLPPGSAYELALQLLLDTLAAMLQQEHKVSDELMKSRASNLE